jgi:hypothetical protein
VPFILRNCIKILVACTCTLFRKRAAGYQKRIFVCLCMKIILGQRRTVSFTLGTASKFLYHALTHLEGETWRSSCLVTMRSQVLQTASCRNAGKDCAHKTQSGRTLCKWELHAPGCLFYALTHQHFAGYEKKELCFLLMIYTTMDLGLFVISCILGKYDSLLAEVLLCHASLCHNILLKFWTVYSRNILKELLCDFV